jgi:hypothetical protein
VMACNLSTKGGFRFLHAPGNRPLQGVLNCGHGKVDAGTLEESEVRGSSGITGINE